ncbi:MAG: class I SAM-dependent methyltransferase [Chthoniobacterales bacterium]
MKQKKGRAGKIRLIHYRDFDHQTVRHRVIGGWLKKLCQDLPECLVVDWSCGSGIGAQTLRTKYPSWKFLMTDVVDTRNQSADLPFTLLDGDLPRLPLADASVNVVLCSEVLEHVHNLTATIREIRRILVPGGLLVGSIPNFRNLASRFSFVRRGLYRIGGKYEGGGHVNYITPEFLTNFVSDHFTFVRQGGDVDWLTWVDFVGFRRAEKVYRSLDFKGLIRENPRYSPLLSYDFLFAYRKKSADL